MSSRSLLCLLFLIVVNASFKDDSKLSLCELVNKRGLICESHQIVTSDGYILHAFRIPGKSGEPTTQKPVVWLQHGIIDSSDSWVYNDDENSLGTWLALQGYDVWLGNSRGNKYSNQHKTLHNHWWNQDYWAFSYQQMGLIDVETVIDYALTTTGQEKLAWVGHSQGTTEMFIALSDPESNFKINNKISVFVALAPVIYLKHGWSVLKTMEQLHVGELIFDAHIYTVFNTMPGLTSALKVFCNIVPILCAPIGEILAQMDPDITNWERTPIMLTREPSGSSTMQFIHYEQDMRDDTFRKYDYGEKLNLKYYHQKTPPEWDISKIQVPMFWYTGGKDVYANPVDTERAREQVESAGYLKEMKIIPEFGHLGFMWSNISGTAYFPDLLQNLKTYLPRQE